MGPGGKFLGSAAMLSIAACGGEQGKLQIRSVGAPPVAHYQAVPFQIAAARGQLALGNVALALESFRKALRDDPSSIEAMIGVAACYDRMARFDLSRRHYEAALAIAPADARLLTAFAVSLDLQGSAVEAASVRNEIRQRLAATKEQTAPQAVTAPVSKPAAAEAARVHARPAVGQKAVAPVLIASAPPVRSAPAAKSAPAAPNRIAEVPAAQFAALMPLAPVAPVAMAAPRKPAPAIARSITVSLPPARPMARAPSAAPVPDVVPAKSAPAVTAVKDVASRPIQISAAPFVPIAPAPTTATPLVQIAPAPATAAPSIARSVTAAIARSETAALSPARTVTEAPLTQPQVEIAVEVRLAARDSTKEADEAKSGPRLERTSLREIALITAPGPQWRTLTINRTQRSATVRFVPLRQASTRFAGIRVLNAARVNRLAARTRSYLTGRGWRAIAIGNAAQVRTRSLILYPAHGRRTAQRLSAQFGFAIVQRPGARQVTILLGRDAARYSALQARG